MKYTVVRNILLGHLEFEVNKLINEGWIPQGGICYDKGTDRLLQAMIKK